MKMLFRQYFWVTLALVGVHNAFWSESLQATPYSVSDSGTVDIYGDSNNDYAEFPPSQAYVHTNGWDDDEGYFRTAEFFVKSESGIIGEKVTVGFTFDLTTEAFFDMGNIPTNSIDFGSSRVWNTYKINIDSEGLDSDIRRLDTNYLQINDPWEKNYLAKNSVITFYGEVETFKQNWISAYVYGNNDLHATSLDVTDEWRSFSIWVNGHAKLTDIFVVSTTSNPVPEPATMLLFGTGLVGILGIRFRRYHSSQKSNQD